MGVEWLLGLEYAIDDGEQLVHAGDDGDHLTRLVLRLQALPEGFDDRVVLACHHREEVQRLLEFAVAVRMCAPAFVQCESGLADEGA